jgi:hypothetical protein
VKARKEAKRKWETWGWYSILSTIAEADIFRSKANMSKMEAAMSANFYEAMIWVAKENDFKIPD